MFQHQIPTMKHLQQQIITARFGLFGTSQKFNSSVWNFLKLHNKITTIICSLMQSELMGIFSYVGHFCREIKSPFRKVWIRLCASPPVPICRWCLNHPHSCRSCSSLLLSPYQFDTVTSLTTSVLHSPSAGMVSSPQPVFHHHPTLPSTVLL